MNRFFLKKKKKGKTDFLIKRQYLFDNKKLGETSNPKQKLIVEIARLAKKWVIGFPIWLFSQQTLPLRIHEKCLG